jgi:hypothetical protein
VSCAGRTGSDALPRQSSVDWFFAHPLRPSTTVARKNGVSGPLGLILSTLPARLAWALYARRRVPARVARARLAERRAASRTSRLIVSNSRTEYRAGVLIGVAPGERAGLLDFIDSLRCYEGGDIKVVVADDQTGLCSGNSRESISFAQESPREAACALSTRFSRGSSISSGATASLLCSSAIPTH